MSEKNVFGVLSKIDCSGHTEKKNGLTYLSWAWAWQMVCENFPEAEYTIYENAQGLNYHTDGNTCWVKTGVTIEGIEHIEYLPVMDMRNRSIRLSEVTSFDVNKAIQRSLTKACARHGLGLYIYAGEDLPSDSTRVTVKDDDGDELAMAVQEARGARSLKSLEDVWNDHPGLKDSAVFRKVVNECKTKLK